jgi:alpha-tubulin suppressor-like RCC1 family protein
VDRLKGVASVSAGGRHSCAALRDGTAWCWGKNSQGQLGDGTQQDRLRPVMVANLRQVRSVHAGAEHSCALLRDGSVWCWGWNVYGQLGDGTIEERRLKPVKVSGPGPVAQLDTGGFHTCVVNRDGRVYCWGKNDIGQLGVGNTKNQPRPTQVKGLTEVTMISTGGAHTCAVDRNGTAWCWGNNESGELGDGSSERRTEPVKVQRLSGVAQISAGGGYLGGHTCAVKRSGTAWCWGNNLSGQLGQGSITQNRPFPGRVGGLKTLATVVASGRHTCAVARDGRVFCWGKNEDGQLGDSTRTDRPRPVQLRQ